MIYLHLKIRYKYIVMMIVKNLQIYSKIGDWRFPQDEWFQWVWSKIISIINITMSVFWRILVENYIFIKNNYNKNIKNEIRIKLLKIIEKSIE